MYQKISKHPSVLNQYEDYLINTGVLTPDIANKIKSDYRKSLETGESVAKNLSKNPNNELWFDWKPYLNVKWWPKVDTKFSAEKLHKLGKEICEIPDSFVLGNQAKKIFEERIKMNDGDIPVNWGYAESMAYASLLEEGYPIRITGQDVRRGTFSHRHACVFDSDSGMGFIPCLLYTSDAADE